jgi:hypothetical protein
MKDIFEASDFEICDDYASMAVVANQKIANMLKGAPRVVGYRDAEYNCWIMDTRPAQSGADTHTAILFNIEPIEKPHECEPDMTSSYIITTCKVCRDALKPTKWEKI